MYQPVLTRKNAVAVKYEEPSDGCGAPATGGGGGAAGEHRSPEGGQARNAVRHSSGVYVHRSIDQSIHSFIHSFIDSFVD